MSIVSSRARTSMIHSASHWPEVEDPSLRPLAVQHAVHLYNHTPNKDSGIAPIEVYTHTINDCQALHNAHPWGCPVCVLESRLSTSAGAKIEGKSMSPWGHSYASLSHREICQSFEHQEVEICFALSIYLSVAPRKLLII